MQIVPTTMPITMGNCEERRFGLCGTVTIGGEPPSSVGAAALPAGFGGDMLSPGGTIGPPAVAGLVGRALVGTGFGGAALMGAAGVFGTAGAIGSLAAVAGAIGSAAAGAAEVGMGAGAIAAAIGSAALVAGAMAAA